LRVAVAEQSRAMRDQYGFCALGFFKAARLRTHVIKNLSRLPAPLFMP
jgi:hypothetical protein